MTVHSEASAGARPRRLLKIGEVCQRLALGETSVRALINDKRLKLVKIGACARITEESVDQLIANASCRRKSGRDAPSNSGGTNARTA